MTNMKRFASLYVSLLALCVEMFAPSTFAAEQPTPELDPTLVAVIADTHVNGLPAERLPKWCGGYTHQAGCLRKTVEEILALRPLPANVIGLGDYAFLWGMPEDYALVAELLAPLERAGIRVTLAMGDHDRRDNFLAQWPRYVEESQVPGRIVTRVDTPHCLFLMLDTVNDDPIGFGEKTRPGDLGAAQRKWLEAELKAAGKPVIACGHHGPRENDVNLAGLLLASPMCKAYFHGHWHRWNPGFERVPGKGLLPRYTLPSTGHWGDIGFALLRTYPDHAVLELPQLDWFGEAGPGTGGSFRDAVLKDRAGAVATIPFREAFAASIAAGEAPAPRHGAAAAGSSGGVGGPPAEPHGAAAASPYGVCSHLTWGEFSARDRTFSLCRVAGLGTVRCDFTWSMVEKPKGSWDFSRTDVIVADAKAAGVAILPILYWDKNDYPPPTLIPIRGATTSGMSRSATRPTFRCSKSGTSRTSGQRTTSAIRRTISLC